MARHVGGEARQERGRRAGSYEAVDPRAGLLRPPRRLDQRGRPCLRHVRHGVSSPAGIRRRESPSIRAPGEPSRRRRAGARACGRGVRYARRALEEDMSRRRRTVGASAPAQAGSPAVSASARCRSGCTSSRSASPRTATPGGAGGGLRGPRRRGPRGPRGRARADRSRRSRPGWRRWRARRRPRRSASAGSSGARRARRRHVARARAARRGRRLPGVEYLLHEVRRDLRQHRLDHEAGGTGLGWPGATPSAAPAAALAAAPWRRRARPAVDPYAGKHPRRSTTSASSGGSAATRDDVSARSAERYLRCWRAPGR